MDDVRGGAPAAPPCAGHGAKSHAVDGSGEEPRAPALDTRTLHGLTTIDSLSERPMLEQGGGVGSYEPHASSAERHAGRVAPAGWAADARCPFFSPQADALPSQLTPPQLSQSAPGFVLAYAPVHPAFAPPALPPLRRAGSPGPVGDARVLERDDRWPGRPATSPRGEASCDVRKQWNCVPPVQPPHDGRVRFDENADGRCADGAWRPAIGPSGPGGVVPVLFGEGELRPSHPAMRQSSMHPSEGHYTASIAGVEWNALPRQWPMQPHSAQLLQPPLLQGASPLLQHQLPPFQGSPQLQQQQPQQQQPFGGSLPVPHEPSFPGSLPLPQQRSLLLAVPLQQQGALHGPQGVPQFPVRADSGSMSQSFLQGGSWLSPPQASEARRSPSMQLAPSPLQCDATLWQRCESGALGTLRAAQIADWGLLASGVGAPPASPSGPIAPIVNEPGAPSGGFGNMPGVHDPAVSAPRAMSVADERSARLSLSTLQRCNVMLDCSVAFHLPLQSHWPRDAPAWPPQPGALHPNSAPQDVVASDSGGVTTTGLSSHLPTRSSAPFGAAQSSDGSFAFSSAASASGASSWHPPAPPGQRVSMISTSLPRGAGYVDAGPAAVSSGSETLSALQRHPAPLHAAAPTAPLPGRPVASPVNPSFVSPAAFQRATLDDDRVPERATVGSSSMLHRSVEPGAWPSGSGNTLTGPHEVVEALERSMSTATPVLIGGQTTRLRKARGGSASRRKPPRSDAEGFASLSAGRQSPAEPPTGANESVCAAPEQEDPAPKSALASAEEGKLASTAPRSSAASVEATSAPSALVGSPSAPSPSESGLTAATEAQRKARAREYNRLAQARFRANVRERRCKAAKAEEASRRALELARAEHAALIAQRDLLERLLFFRDDCAKVLDIAARLAREGSKPGPRWRSGAIARGNGRRGVTRWEPGGVVGRWMGPSRRSAPAARDSWLDACAWGGWSSRAGTQAGLPTSYLLGEERSGTLSGATPREQGSPAPDDATRITGGWNGGADWVNALVHPLGPTQAEGALASPPGPAQTPGAPASPPPSTGGGAIVAVSSAVARPEIHDTVSPTSSAPAPPVHALFEAVRKLELPELRGLTPGQRAWFDAMFFMIAENEFTIPVDEELAQADVESLMWHFQLLGLQFACERRLVVLGENGSIGVEASDASRPDGGSTTLGVVSSEHASEFVAQVVGSWVVVDDEEERKKKKRSGKDPRQGSSVDSGTRSGSRIVQGAAPVVSTATEDATTDLDAHAQPAREDAQTGVLSNARASRDVSTPPEGAEPASSARIVPLSELRTDTISTAGDSPVNATASDGAEDGDALQASAPAAPFPRPSSEAAARPGSTRECSLAKKPEADAKSTARTRAPGTASTRSSDDSTAAMRAEGSSPGRESTSLSSVASVIASPCSSLVSPPSADSGAAQCASSSLRVPKTRLAQGRNHGHGNLPIVASGRAPGLQRSPSWMSSSNDLSAMAVSASGETASTDAGAVLHGAVPPLDGAESSDAVAAPESPTGSSSTSPPPSPVLSPEQAVSLPVAIPRLNPDIVTPLISCDVLAERGLGGAPGPGPSSSFLQGAAEELAGVGTAPSVATSQTPADSAPSPSQAARSLESVLSTPLPVLSALGPEGLEQILQDTPELKEIAEILFTNGRGPASLGKLLATLSTGMFKTMTLKDLIGTDPGLLLSLGLGGASVGGAGGGRGVAALAGMLADRSRGLAAGNPAAPASSAASASAPDSTGRATPGIDDSGKAPPPPLVQSSRLHSAPSATPAMSLFSPPAADSAAAPFSSSAAATASPDASPAVVAPSLASPSAQGSEVWVVELLSRPGGPNPEEALHNEYLVGRSMSLMALSQQGEGLSLEPADAHPEAGLDWSPLAREARAQVLRLMRTLLERRPEDIVPVFRGDAADVAAAERDPEHWRRAVRGIGLRPLQKVALADLAGRVRLALAAIMRRRKSSLEALLRVLKDEGLTDIQTAAARSARAFALLNLCRDTLSDERAVWMHVYARFHRVADSKQMLVLRMLAWPCHTDLGKMLDVVLEDVTCERALARERAEARKSRARARRVEATLASRAGSVAGAATGTVHGASGAGVEKAIRRASDIDGATSLVDSTPSSAAAAPASVKREQGKRRSFGEGIRRAFDSSRVPE